MPLNASTFLLTHPCVPLNASTCLLTSLRALERLHIPLNASLHALERLHVPLVASLRFFMLLMHLCSTARGLLHDCAESIDVYLQMPACVEEKGSLTHCLRPCAWLCRELRRVSPNTPLGGMPWVGSPGGGCGIARLTPSLHVALCVHAQEAEARARAEAEAARQEELRKQDLQKGMQRAEGG